MNLDDLTLGQIKEIQALLGNKSEVVQSASSGLNDQVGKYVIIRTYSAGVHAGILEKKSGTEVYLKNSRRLWSWKAEESISLSGVAKYGINQKQSKIAPCVDIQWLDAIEILSVTDIARKSIEEAEEQSQD